MLYLKVSLSKLIDIFRKLNTARLLKLFRDSVVGIGTRYGLEGSGIKSLWVASFSHPSGPALDLTQPLYTLGTGSFLRVKRPGRGGNHPPTSTAEVKERVPLYLYSPCEPPWPVLG